MNAKLGAHDRIKLALGSHFIESQILQDRVEELTEQLAQRDALIGKLDATIADLQKPAEPPQETPAEPPPENPV